MTQPLFSIYSFGLSLLQQSHDLLRINVIRLQQKKSSLTHLSLCKSGQMAGLQRCGRPSASLFSMIINQLKARCTSASIKQEK